MSALDNYAQNKKAFVDAFAAEGVELNNAAQKIPEPPARKTVKMSADAVTELVGYLNSPILDRVIKTFHSSATERAQAAKDLKKYLTDAGLVSSDRVEWELHDNNWCVDAQVTIHEGEQRVGYAVHYDSETGFAGGVC